MDLKEIAAVSGKGGLFKVLKPTRTGVILETIDKDKARFVATGNNRVSLLKEISIYTTGKEASMPLEDVFNNIYVKHTLSIPVNSKSSNQELESFIESVLPDYDRDRVYPSDIKKLVSWYTILANYMPDIFKKESEATEQVETEEKDNVANKAEKKAEKAPKAEKPETEKKPKAKSASAKK